MNAIWDDRLDQAIQSGQVSQDSVNDKIVRVLTPYFALSQDTKLPETDFSRSVVSEKHNEIIRNVSANAITLLKNNQTLNSTFGLPIQEKGLRDIILVGSAATYGAFGVLSVSARSSLST